MLRALSLLPLALTPVESVAAQGRPLSCAEAEEEYEEDLGDLSGRPIQIRICTAAQGDLQRVHVQIRWIAAGEDTQVIQALRDDVGVAPAGAYQPSLAGDDLRLTWPSAGPLDPTGQTTTAVWRWDEHAHRFSAPQLSSTSPWAEGLARLHTALDAGDFSTARAEVATLGTSPNGGKTSEDDTLFLDFLTAANRVARTRARLFDTKGAAAVEADLLDEPPVTSPDPHPSADRLVICGGLAATCDGEGSFNALPATADVANKLTAAAFYLARGKQPEGALALLHTVLARFGVTPDLQLLVADALWAANRREEAAAAYRAYGQMPGAKAVKRAVRRGASRAGG